MAQQFDCPDHVSVVWSQVNRAYFLLFGTGPMASRTVLGVVNEAAEVRERLRDMRDSSRRAATV